MPGARKKAEYFDRHASPAATPAASHQAPAPRRAFAAHQRVSIQNRLPGASGTASSPPRPIRKAALSQIPARAATRSDWSNSRATSKVIRVIRALERIGSRRTPSGPSPATWRPIQIHQAIIGGWSM